MDETHKRRTAAGRKRRRGRAGIKRGLHRNAARRADKGRARIVGKIGRQRSRVIHRDAFLAPLERVRRVVDRDVIGAVRNEEADHAEIVGLGSVRHA